MKSDKIYNYIYMLIMVIGTVTLTYQLLFFRNSRKMSNGILKKLGATNGQIALATLVEHIAILVAVVVAQIASVGCEAGALLKSGRRKKAGAKVKRYRKVGKCRLNRHNIYRKLSFRDCFGCIDNKGS